MFKKARMLYMLLIKKKKFNMRGIKWEEDLRTSDVYREIKHRQDRKSSFAILRLSWLHICVCISLYSDTHNQVYAAHLWTYISLSAGWGNFVCTGVLATVVVLQQYILNAATLRKGKERMQQGEWCLVNKLLKKSICVLLQGYSLFPSSFGAGDVVFAY